MHPIVRCVLVSPSYMLHLHILRNQSIFDVTIEEPSVQDSIFPFLHPVTKRRSSQNSLYLSLGLLPSKHLLVCCQNYAPRTPSFDDAGPYNSLFSTKALGLIEG